jgi:hypothetical protein
LTLSTYGTVRQPDADEPRRRRSPQRYLDCAVINHIHSIIKRDKGKAFDAVRGVFLEGKRIYNTSGFYEKTRIQICVRNLSNIKGVFRVPDNQLRSE